MLAQLVFQLQVALPILAVAVAVARLKTVFNKLVLVALEWSSYPYPLRLILEQLQAPPQLLLRVPTP